MAKQKKEKQIPAKQQYYEQIISKQLYGAPPTREEGIAKLQADYDAWNKRQEGIAALQADYDAWHKSQQPVEQPKAEMPRVEKQKAETPKAERQKSYAELHPESIPKSISYDEMFGKKKNVEVKAPEEKVYKTHADIIPSLTKANVEKQKKKEQNKEQSIAKIAKQLGITEEEVKERMNPSTSKLVDPKSVKIDEEATKQTQEAIAEERRKAAQKKHGVWDAFTGRMAKASKDVVNAPVAIAGEIAGKDWSLYSDAQKQELKELQEQHPVASGAGDMAGMAFAALSLGGGIGGAASNAVNAGQVLNALKDEAILNGATKGQALAMALKGALPVLASNAASAMPVDLATDIIPTLANDIAEGEKSDAEIVRDTLLNTGINAGFDAIGDIASIANAVRKSGNAVNADNAFAGNIREGAERLSALNAEDAAKQIDVPNVPEIEAPKVEVPKIETPKTPSQASLPQETFDKIDSYFEELTRPMNEVQNSGLMKTVTDEKALKEWDNLNAAYSDYLNKSMFSDNVEEITAAKKTLDNTRKRYARAMKNIDPEVSAAFNSGSYGYRIGRPLNARNAMAPTEEQADEAFELIRELEESNKPQSIDNVPQNKVMAAEMEGAKAPDSFTIEEELPPGKGFVEDGKSRVLTNSAVNANIIDVDALKNDPILQDIAKYDKHKNSEIFNQAMKRIEEEGDSWVNDIISGKKSIADDVDVDSAMITLQDLATKIDEADEASKIALTAQRNSMLSKLREYGTRSGQGIQAFAKWNNTADGALLAAGKLQEDEVVKPWLSKNVQAKERNSRIAKALADMGNNTKAKKEVVPLTHEQIKAGVRAELEKEFGSIEQYFNDNDLEYLTMLAEDKSIPVWKITDEIEHKLNHGSWYTLDESIEPKMPTNKKLQNALNSLIDGNVRAEKTEPTLAEIANEVRNTLNKESASLGADFTDDDVNYIAGLIKGKATTNEIASALNTKLATGNFGVSFETQQKVSDLFKYIENKNPNSREFVEAQAEAFRLLAEEIAPKATFLEKFDTWRYMAMLGNPKTMLRNLVGNKMFGFVTGFSNNLAALGEAGVDKAIRRFGGEGIQRTKSVLNPIKDSKLIDASAADVDESVFRQLQGPKYEKMDKDFLRRSRSAWNSKVMRKAEELVDKGISDYGALKKKYTTSLAGYLKANGYDESVFEAADKFAKLQRESKTRLLTAAEQADMDDLGKVASDLDKAREYAIKQAEYATFHEDNVVADLISRASRVARESKNPIAKALGYSIEGTVPFKKTPANILRSGIEYSPLGAIDSIRKTGKLIYENTGKRAGNLADKTLAADVIDSWAKSLTGVGLAYLGHYLYNKGVLHISDPDLKYQDQLEGMQNYAIDINGHTYTMDWAVPAFMPIYLGAEIAKVNQALGKTDEESYAHISDYLSLANRIAQPIVETSMLQGIKDTIETAVDTASNGAASVLVTLPYSTLSGYATQAIPTLSGQIARTVDNTRRSTYSDKEDPIERTLDKQGKKILNKLPGLSTLNQPYVDTYGREQRNSPFNNSAGNLAYQMLSPGYYSKVNTTPADEISRKVYDYNKTESTLPKYQTSFKDSDGNRVSPEDFTTASKAYGKANKEIRDALANDKWFNGLDKKEQEKILTGVNTISEHVGKLAIDSTHDVKNNAYKAYINGGIPSLKDYYVKEHAKDIAEESGLDSRSKASQEIQEEILNGNTSAAEQKISEASKIIDSGINAHGYDVYKARKSNISNMDNWISEYKKIDGYGNSDGFVNQDEFISAIKKNGWSEDEAVKYAEMYGNWKYIPYLKKDGTWGFHKAK